MNTSTDAPSLLAEAIERSRNVAAEQALLGSILIDPDECLAQGLDDVRMEYFTTPLHREVWREIVAARDRGERIDAGLIGQRVSGRVDVLEYSRLLGAVPSAANFRERLDACMAAYRKRIYVDGGARVLQLAAEQGSRIEDIERDWDDTGTRSRMVVLGREAEPIGAILTRVVEETASRTLGRECDRIASGIAELDALFDGGFGPGTLNILAARPSIGKTTLALNMAWPASAREPVLFITLEMSPHELAAKVLSNAAGFTSHALRAGVQLNDGELSELRAAAERECGRRLYVAEPRRCTISAIASTIRQEVSRRGARQVFVDYLQLIEGPRRDESRYEQVCVISRDLKLLARELDVPLVVLAQLNRQPATRRDPKPFMSDLRDSGSIEQDADTVMLLHWPWKHDAKKPRDQVDLIVAKNRHGPTGTIRLRFEPEFSRLTSAGPSDA